MRTNKKLITTPIALGAAALLALCACAEEEADTDNGQHSSPDVEEPEQPDPDDQDDGEDGDNVADPNREDEQPDIELPPGGGERIDDEDIDPEEQGQPVNTQFSEAGETVALIETAADREPLEVYAAPPSGPGDSPEVVAELSADQHVVLAGREISAARADGIWVEIELADGYGWIDAAVLSGFAIDEPIGGSP